MTDWERDLKAARERLRSSRSDMRGSDLPAIEKEIAKRKKNLVELERQRDRERERLARVAGREAGREEAPKHDATEFLNELLNMRGEREHVFDLTLRIRSFGTGVQIGETAERVRRMLSVELHQAVEIVRMEGAEGVRRVPVVQPDPVVQSVPKVQRVQPDPISDDGGS